MDESKLLTTVAQYQPVKIPLFSAKSIGSTHTTDEHSACVKIRREFRGSCVICGQRLTYLPCAKKKERKKKNIDITETKTIKKKTILVNKAECLHKIIVSPEILYIS